MPANLIPTTRGPDTNGTVNVHAGNMPNEDMVRLTLDNRGVIHDCNSAAEALFKYSSTALVGQHVAVLLPQLASFAIVKEGEINSDLRFLCRIGRPFEAVDQHGHRFASQLFLTALDGTRQDRLSLVVRPVDEITSGPLQSWDN